MTHYIPLVIKQDIESNIEGHRDVRACGGYDQFEKDYGIISAEEKGI